MMSDRRSVLKAALVSPALLCLPNVAAATPLSGDVGVASGEPQPNSVIIWTRVPEAAQSSSVMVSYKVSLTSDLRNPVATGTHTTDSTQDYTVKVLVSGLQPFTRYYYGFSTTTGYVSLTGRTKTAPAATANPAQITFAYFSCQDFSSGYYNVYANLIAQDDVDFCVHLGDNIYADAQGGNIRPDPATAVTLDEYRAKHKLYLSDPNLRTARQNFPWIYLWDDHEVYNDYAGQTVDTNTPGQRQNGYTAFLNYMPVFPSFTSSTPYEVRLYRKLSFGSLMDVFVLDERQYRSAPPCDPYYLTTGCGARNDTNRTMLGQAQKDWLTSGLSSATGRWKFILNEVMFQEFLLADFSIFGVQDVPQKLFKNPAPAGLFGFNVYVDLDAWDGFASERSDLIEVMSDVRNVVFCTGDIHNCYAGDIRPDFSKTSQPSVAVEVTGGSVTSGGLSEITGVNLNYIGAPAVLSANPSMKYVNLTKHVFTKMVVTPQKVTVTYEAVNTITKTTYKPSVLKKFTVNDGNPTLIVN